MSELHIKDGETRLSYSSLGVLQKCEQKFAHAKVYKTPKDSDYKDGDALGIGKATHYVLEQTKWKAVAGKDVEDGMLENEVPRQHKNLIIAMAMAAVELNKASGLNILVCEFAIQHPDYVGYIDAIATQDGGYWWIIDFKTASSFDEKMLPLLPLDLQLNLYSYFKDEIARALSLDPDKFLGCKYRQATKSKAEQQEGETDAEFIKRLLTPGPNRYNKNAPWKAPVSIQDFTVHYSRMNPKLAWEIIQENLIRAKELKQGEAPKRNYKSCLDFFKPCEYFSQCHGTNHSDGSAFVKVDTVNTYLCKSVL